MDIEELGPLQVRQIVKATGTTPENADRTPLTVILMHGYGAPGDDLVGLAGGIDAPVGTTFVFPEAPALLGGAGMDFGDARAWWEIDVSRFQRALARGNLDEVMNEVPTGLSEATDRVLTMLDALERERGVAAERVVLGGFSQGSMLALDVALRSTRPFAGLALLSSTLLAQGSWVPLMAARAGLRVFQSHGSTDGILPYAIADRLRRALVDAGLKVSFTSFDGGHGVPPSVVRDLGAWLRTVA
jgi:phospholipase/carboxylesterase